MSHLLAILALMRAWINKITPESSIVHYHSFSMPVSLLCVPNSPSSITYCNIVVKAILQTQPRWPHEREVMFTILPCWPLTVLQHPNTIEYRENPCVLLADIPHMEIHISPRSIINSNLESFQLSHHSQGSNQIYLVLQILNATPIAMLCGHRKCSNFHA